MFTEGYCVLTVMKTAVFVWVPVAITHPDESKLGGKEVIAAEA